MPSTHSLISDKARCCSQSERALYGNFIININIYFDISFLVIWLSLHYHSLSIGEGPKADVLLILLDSLLYDFIC